MDIHVTGTPSSSNTNTTTTTTTPLSSYDVLLLDTHITQSMLKDYIPSLTTLRWIHTLLAGVDELPHQLLPPSIPLTNSRGVYKNSLAEFACFAMLYFAKDIPRILQQQRNKQWNKFNCEELTFKTVAILSFGAMGQATAVRARAHGMRVIATRRNPDIKDPLVEEMYGPQDTALVMSKADYIVCCSPLTPETRLMVGEKEIAAMKPTAVFINIGRGWVVDEPALIKALQEKRIRGAALDVFQQEPLPESSPLWSLENVLLSPHCTDNTMTWKQDSAKLFLDNVQRYISGDGLVNIVDKQAGY